MTKVAIKNIKKSHEMKEEATLLFKENNIDQAINKFKECLDIDDLNINYNAQVCLNIAIGLNKQKKNEEALKFLNRAVQMNS